MAIALALASATIDPAMAGTTGGLRGRVVDQATSAGISGVLINAVSPSQSETARTNAAGEFAFISLSPDTYTVSAQLQGYDASSATATVLADQVQNVPTFALAKTLKTIGSARARASVGLVRAGATSDVYSVNSAGQAASAAVGGPGGLNQAYSAIATTPGANVPQGQQGWNQLVYIRGGDYSDVANELDGIPVQRASDYAPITTLASLGSQEVQTYTGGTPPSAEASGLSGFINQVIKTGTYPGYEDFRTGVGAPTFYHQFSAEASGATSNRNFTYYIATGAENQDYRYSDQFNGASNPLFFYPLYIPTNNGSVYDGSGTPLFCPGQNYAIANTTERDTIGNFHFELPHKDGGLKDDIQLLAVNSDIQTQFYSSPNDLGGPSVVGNAYGSSTGLPTFTDDFVYRGPLFTAPNPNDVGISVSPFSETHTPFAGNLGNDQRDGDDHSASIYKLQYQKNFSPTSYLRLYGYSEYNDWFINGPVSAFTTFGGEIQDYEVHGNDYGVTSTYANQLSDKHLLTATASYQTQKLETYSGNNYQGAITTNLVDAKGNCYNPSSGAYASCFSSFYDGNGGGLVSYGSFGAAPSGYPTLADGVTPCPLSLTAIQTTATSFCTPYTLPAGSAAVANKARYLVTNDGQSAQIDEITPFYSAVSVADQWHPNDRVTVNAGVRLENFTYRLDDTVSNYPARQFWFDAYNREYSFGSSATSVGQCTDSSGDLGVDPTTGASLCTPGTNADLANTSPRTESFTAIQPRLSGTYTINRDTVLRASYGRYAAPAPTSYQQYNVVQQDLPTFIGQFLPYGFNTPFHESRPSYSNNYDFSLEKQIHGTDIAFKLTPFYRSTQDQLANIPIGTQGVLDGLNVGRQRNYGVEFQIRKGDFDRQGFAALLSYTFTRSRVTYNNFGNSGRNEIDNLNDYIRNYNAYTKSCSSSQNTALCGTTTSGALASPCYVYVAGSGGVADPTCTVTAQGSPIANPYYNDPAQPLMDRTGEYTPYDILPAPFQGANGYETPDVATLVLNYKIKRLSITPSATYSSGSFYGSPLTYPGYDPTTCTAVTSGTTADTTTCNYIFIPDKYSGHFDTFGSYREPTRLTTNLQFSYETGPKVKFTLTMTGLMDQCYQRHEPWDSGSTCVYAQLASNLLAPAGNFVSNPPIQLAYPYGSWYNNSQTGFVGQKIPFNAFLSADIRL
jgi:Carboxypeptidase regulatory-like domain/TonB dependent receptor